MNTQIQMASLYRFEESLKVIIDCYDFTGSSFPPDPKYPIYVRRIFSTESGYVEEVKWEATQHHAQLQMNAFKDCPLLRDIAFYVNSKIAESKAQQQDNPATESVQSEPEPAPFTMLNKSAIEVSGMSGVSVKAMERAIHSVLNQLWRAWLSEDEDVGPGDEEVIHTRALLQKWDKKIPINCKGLNIIVTDLETLIPELKECTFVRE